jgi:hypothetical protein
MRLSLVLSLSLLATLGVAAPGLADPNATITGSFSDSCRDFQAHSSKDISHVEIHYGDGRVVKDESVASPDYSIDGGAGDEIASAIVKSGRTTQQFDCRGDSPPTALLEANRPDVGWTSEDSGPYGPGWSCCYGDFPPVPFRGINSTDPDNDIVSWSIDFGDGTSTGEQSWITDPPTEVQHTYQSGCFCTAVLTVTDSAGHSSSDEMKVAIDDDGYD